MTLGAQDLLKDFGSPLNVAEAFILGLVPGFRHRAVRELVDPIILETARIRLQASGKLTPEHITTICKSAAEGGHKSE